MFHYSLVCFIICCVSLQCWEDREGRKAMSKNNAKGLTTLRQKLKKYNRDFESDVASYREVGAFPSVTHTESVGFMFLTRLFCF